MEAAMNDRRHFATEQKAAVVFISKINGLFRQSVSCIK